MFPVSELPPAPQMWKQYSKEIYKESKRVNVGTPHKILSKAIPVGEKALIRCGLGDCVWKTELDRVFDA